MVSSICKTSNFGVCHLSRLVLPDSRNWDSQQKGGEPRKVIGGQQLEPGHGACLGLQTGASSWECRQGFPVVASHGTSSSGRQEQRYVSRWNHPQRQGRSEFCPTLELSAQGMERGASLSWGLSRQRVRVTEESRKYSRKGRFNWLLEAMKKEDLSTCCFSRVSMLWEWKLASVTWAE